MRRFLTLLKSQEEETQDKKGNEKVQMKNVY
jgi:hypothetical protein